MKEELKYTIEMEIDGHQYFFSMPYGAPVTAALDATTHFALVMKKKVDEYYKKMEVEEAQEDPNKEEDSKE